MFGDEFSLDFTVYSKPLKPFDMWQKLVGLGLVAFVWEARQWRKMLNFHRVGQNAPTDLSRFWFKGHGK